MNVISALSTGATTKSSADTTWILYYAIPTLASELACYKVYNKFKKDTTFLRSSFVLYLIVFTAFSGYSPIKNIIQSVVEMASFHKISFASSHLIRENLNCTTNVVIILNESMGNGFFQSEMGMNASR
jgi:hypothetical protein